MTVKNKIKGYKEISVDDFLKLTENNLKKNAIRNIPVLKESIKKGIVKPIAIWKDYIVDGAGRKQAIQELLDEGEKFDKIPVYELNAKNLTEAKKIALVLSQKEAKLNQSDFNDFVDFEWDGDFDFLDLDIQLPNFEPLEIREDIVNKESSEIDLEELKKDVKENFVKCPYCHKEFKQ